MKPTNELPIPTDETYWVELSEPKQEKFEEAVRPLMKYLAENHHPHNSVYVTSRTAELLEGKKCLNTNEYLID